MSEAFQVVDSVTVQASKFQMATYMIARTKLTDEDSLRAYVNEGLREGEIECEGSNPEIGEVVFFHREPGLICIILISDYQSP